MSVPHSEFDYVKNWVLGREIFDSPLGNVETGHISANGASSLSPEVNLQPVEKYVRSTLDIDIPSLRQNHTV
jgi:hypothetical protein